MRSDLHSLLSHHFLDGARDIGARRAPGCTAHALADARLCLASQAENSSNHEREDAGLFDTPLFSLRTSFTTDLNSWIFALLPRVLGFSAGTRRRILSLGNAK